MLTIVGISFADRDKAIYHKPLIVKCPLLTEAKVKVRSVLKLLKKDGWYVFVTVGSHRQLKHPNKSGRVTVSGHESDDIHPKTLKSILTQAGLKK